MPTYSDADSGQAKVPRVRDGEVVFAEAAASIEVRGTGMNRKLWRKSMTSVVPTCW